MTPKNPPAIEPKPIRSDAVSIELQALEKRCGYGPPLGNAMRVTLENRIRRLPSSITERVLVLAVRNKGVVAGIALDPVAMKAALAAADEAEAGRWPRRC
jgi:hypothetical protein